jgi:hypothetical protein
MDKGRWFNSMLIRLIYIFNRQGITFDIINTYINRILLTKW